MTHRTAKHTSTTHEDSLGVAPLLLRLVVILSCVIALGAMIHELLETRQSAADVAPQTTSPPSPSGATNASSATILPTLSVVPSAVPSAAPSAIVTRIGIVAGHWGSDKGAECSDGLTEVEINLDVARRVVHILQGLGYQVDLLKEFDSRLNEYRADALISIHADSCQAYPNATPPASGFKVASVEDSLVPEEEKHLVACLSQCYAAQTGMYFHSNSITDDMSRYHTFYEIDGNTPGVIIETGFMLNDRRMLTQRADLVAQGIVDGIVCFVEDEGP